MNAERWKVVDDLLQSALQVAPEQRDEFLRKECSGDPALLEEIKSLVTCYRRARDFLETSALRVEARAAAEEQSSQPLVEQKVSHYRILRRLGWGGMGSVWLAERCDGRFERQVAIKFINLAMIGHGSTERFKREGSILGKLAHPQIAELIDAGVTENGEPYLVLEYVEGRPIDEYCDEHELNVEARITLFLDVLSAVAHAHSNLIVHRDIKPSNVLVRRDGQVKLLDFGIAKLLGDETSPGSATLLTLEAGGALTPKYAAPEQVTEAAITTATDVYGLGVLLYVLLTGQHPAGPDVHSPAQLIKAVVEREPSRASDAVASTELDVAAKRASTPDRLRRQLRGDLDTIIAKTLKKDPAERYMSAPALADDLRRFMTHQPISARSDTAAYRARKFIRRHRLAVAVASLALATIVAVSAIAVYQARVAERRFQDVRKLAHTFVFDLHDKVAKLEGSTEVREMMVRTGRDYLDNLARSAGRDLELQREIAAAFMKIGDAEGYPTKPNLGRVADALASYERAGDIYRKISQKDPAYLPDLANYYLSYAGLVRLTHDLTRARELSETAVRTFDQVRVRQDLDGGLAAHYVQAWCVLGDMDEDLNHFRQAWTEFSKCGDLARAQLDRKRDQQALSQLSQADERIATASQELGLLSEALRALDEDEALLSELLATEPQNPSFHRRMALVHSYRAEVYYADLSPSFGDPVRGLASARRYLETTEAMVRADPSNTAAQFSSAVATYWVSFSLREFDANAAVKLARDSVRIFDQIIASGKPSYLVTSRRVRALVRLGEAQLKARRFAEARSTARLALDAERPLASRNEAEWTDEHVELVQVLVLAGEASAAMGEFKNAGDLMNEARTRAQPIAQSGELSTLIPLANAEQASGELYAAWHRNKQARACYQRLIDLWQKFPESNEYVNMQRVASMRLIASLDAPQRPTLSKNKSPSGSQR